MGNSALSGPTPDVLDDFSSAETSGSSLRKDISRAYLVNLPFRESRGRNADDISSPSADLPLCCSEPRPDNLCSFASKEEALMKARYYRDRDVEMAKKAYAAALNLTGPSMAASIPHDVSIPVSDCGCNIVPCSGPQGETMCWLGAKLKSNMSDGHGHRKVSIGGISTALTSGSLSRMHTSDMEELVVSEHMPRYMLLHNERASCEGGSLKDAVPAVASQFEDCRFQAEIHAELADLHLANGEAEDAIGCYEKAMSLAPEELSYLYKRGVVLQQVGRRSEAIQCFRGVLQLDASNRPALFNLGVCLNEEGTTRREALETFQQLLSFDPRNENALELIADIYEKEGRIADAHNYMQRVVALDPSNFRACRDLARLETMLKSEGRIPGYVPLN